MNRKTLLLILTSVLIASIIAASGIALAASTPTVWTDKEDYQSGETVTIYGTGFSANKKLVVQILRPQGTDMFPVRTDESGSFTLRYKLSPNRAMCGIYTVLVIDPETGQVLASTTFTDSPGGEWRVELWGWDMIAGWSQGELKGYKEGDLVGFKLKITNNMATTNSTPQINSVYDFFNDVQNAVGIDAEVLWQNGTTDFTDRCPSGYTTIVPDIANEAYDKSGNTFRQYYQFNESRFSVPAGGSIYIYFQAHLAETAYWKTITAPLHGVSGPHNGASYFPGSSLQVELALVFTGVKAQTQSMKVGLAAESLSGVKFHDLNGNGTRDAGEPGLLGWNITLQGIDLVGNTFTAWTATNATGGYSFLELPLGYYNISEVLQPGWTQTYPPSGTYINVSVNETQRVVTGIDFGNFQNFNLTVIKLEDMTGNGTSPDDQPIASWNITLWRNGIPQETKMTNDSGMVGWMNLGPGEYNVTEEVPSAWVPTSATFYPFNATSGQNQSFTFTNFREATVIVWKYEDMDGDLTTPDRTAINWTVALRNATYPAGMDFALDGDGTITFDGQRPGTVNVTEADDLAWIHLNATTSWEQVMESGKTYTVVFVNFHLGSISGYKFNDTYGDGVDGGEPRLQGWEINLYLNVSGVWVWNATDTTDGDGLYNFTCLGPGQYLVNETLKAGWTQTYPAYSTGPETIGYQRTITSGADYFDLAFGNFQNVTISGYKLEDMTGDGETGDDEPKEGWTIWLRNATSGATMLTTTTDNNGYYEFPSVGPGLYNVTEEIRSDWTNTSVTWYVFHAVSGHAYMFNFTNFHNVNITVYKFEDITGNGTSLDDIALAGWTVRLLNDSTQVGADQSTDTYGNYTWTNLGPGNYSVSETVPSGWTNTSATYHNFGVVMSGQSYTFTFTNFQNVNISVRKMNDLTGDGLTGDDTPISGWTVKLYNDSTLIDTKTTGADGWYNWTNIGPGHWNVTEVVQAGWTNTSATSVDFGQVTSGHMNYTFVFTNLEHVGISGYKFEDLTGDGETNDDLPKSGWTIWLKNATTDTVIATDITDANGFYEFLDLTPGSYNVTEELRPDWTPTSDTWHVFDNVMSGQSWNFTNFHNVNISVRKMNDLTGDGLTEDDTPIAGWTVQLWNDSVKVDGDQLTGADGWYNWTNLGPGMYGVNETVPAGWTTIGPTNHDFGLVESGHANYTWVFTNFENVSITVRKFNDVTGNGWSADDQPLQGWTMQLYKDDALIDTQNTGLDGSYTWPSLGPGSYNVTEVMQAGWMNTSATSVNFGPVQSGQSYSFNFTNTMPTMPMNVTRTQGFWATHNSTTVFVFISNLSSHITIGNVSTGNYKEITNSTVLMGAFWSNVAHMSNGTRRTAIDQARMILVQQLVAAILNHAAFGTPVPTDTVTGLDLITAANNTYSSTNRTEILRLASLLDTYNQSGDDEPLPSWMEALGPATPPRPAQRKVYAKYWDNPFDP